MVLPAHFGTCTARNTTFRKPLSQAFGSFSSEVKAKRSDLSCIAPLHDAFGLSILHTLILTRDTLPMLPLSARQYKVTLDVERGHAVLQICFQTLISQNHICNNSPRYTEDLKCPLLRVVTPPAYKAFKARWIWMVSKRPEMQRNFTSSPEPV